MRIIFNIVVYFFWLMVLCQPILGDDFYSIGSVQHHTVKNKEGVSFVRLVNIVNNERSRLPLPFIEMKVKTAKRTLCSTVIAKAYFYDSSKKFTGLFSIPSSVKRSNFGSYAIPTFFEANVEESLFFVFPEKLRKTKNLYIVLVFGDKEGVSAMVYPQGNPQQFSFPEKIYLNRQPKKEREEASKPFVEHILTIRKGSQNQLTLFLLPKLNQKKIAGVFAACLLANNVEEIRKRIMFTKKSDELFAIMEYCKKNNLALLCWGAQTIWDKRRNWDEIDKDIYRDYDHDFDHVARAWERGVNQLCSEYQVPKEGGFLLWGTSKAAQYAMRLAMRCPKYFHAVYVHIPSSFDKPVLEGNNILWCLTTGEQEYGYERSLRFFQQCRALAYPIVYKAIPGLGHKDHQGCRKFGFIFFDYALTLCTAKQKRIKDRGFDKKLGLWNKEFDHPPYWGDAINQNIFSAEKFYSISSSYRIPLPNEKLAKEWKRLK
ncbi:hypothetical protein [Akkermansia muciniphila]|uniref:hypothetical protein n=1 Tax=Akkermansia muciniphila TaxID=239935 RepID=UPI00319DED88